MEDTLAVAIKAAKQAGAILRRNFRVNNPYSFKADGSIVCGLDTVSEHKITSIISERFFDHAFVGEETGQSSRKSDWLWIIDPLDGTSNYVNKIPIFAVSIALSYKSKVIMGVIYSPFLDDLYYAQVGKGAYLNGQRIVVSKAQVLKDSQIVFGRTSLERERFGPVVSSLSFQIRTPRAFGCFTQTFAYLAAGSIDGAVLLGAKIWDVAAGFLLVQEAGGMVGDLKGVEWTLGTSDIVASNGKIHDQLLAALRA